MLARKHRTLAFCIAFVLIMTVTMSNATAILARSNMNSGSPGAMISLPMKGVPVSTRIKAGGLTERNTTPFLPGLTVDGKHKTFTYTLSIQLSDATGSGSGWNLSITSTPFTSTPFHNRNTTFSLPNNASAVTAVTAKCAARSTCTRIHNTILYPLVVPAGPKAPRAVKFFDATRNTGMGMFIVIPTITVSIPAQAQRGFYTCTIVLAIVKGP